MLDSVLQIEDIEKYSIESGMGPTPDVKKAMKAYFSPRLIWTEEKWDSGLAKEFLFLN